MKFAVVGAGAVGGFYGAMLAKAGHDVAFVARGAHRDAIVANGLKILSAPDSVGEFTVKCQVESDPAKIGPVDLVILAIKTYSNAETFPTLKPLLGPKTSILTLQNGVDSADELAAAFGKERVIGGATYIAAGIEAPGVIRHTGTHRRIVYGEYFDARSELSPRVAALKPVFEAADIQTEAVTDLQTRVWEKFIYLAPMAAFTGASRLPIGPVWGDEFIREMFLSAVDEVERVARASGVKIEPGVRNRITSYTAGVPKTMRSSLLIDLSQGKKIEVEALQGSVVRRGAAVGVPTPIMSALYAVLKPHAKGAAG
ncbi:MAG: 2-dehydropantoate 2-reductase [Acidobacteria bacterium]|nr:MAG: 2-dehydropantoate 2-reductase [Acidobacteriota bacterium]